MKAFSQIVPPKQAENPDDLVSYGEMKLLQGYFAEATSAFDQAEEIAGKSDPSVYYRQGLAFFEYGSEEDKEQALLVANKKFKMANSLYPESVDILHAWGSALTLLGERMEEHHFFLSAKEKFEKALGYSGESAELYWDYGIIWYHIGLHSGEAVDLQKAIKSYEQAIDTGESLPGEFWIDFGATALLLSTKVRDVRQIVKAVNCFKHAISFDDKSFESWASLAEALQLLYHHTHDEDHFTQANEAFSTAAKLSPGENEHWIDWASFLLTGARKNKDVKRLRACIEKCHRAYALEPQCGQTLAIWAEALALLGKETERLDLIYEAENKVQDSLDIDEDNPETWYSLGMCYHSFGTYFNDADYYHQAIEKFQEGLTIDRTCDYLWHAIGNTYSTIAALEEDVEIGLQSLKFFRKALEIQSSSSRHIDYARVLSQIGEYNHDEERLKEAQSHFEYALSLQKNAVYLHPDWLFSYACTLDLLGDFSEDEKLYTKAIEIFSHVLMVDPDFPQIHHRLSSAFSHLGELLGEVDHFYRAIHHLRLSLKHEEDNDLMILDWGVALVNISQYTPVLTDTPQLLHDAEQKLTLSAKLGNAAAYYQLACLYSLQKNLERSLYFLQKAAHYQALPPLEELLCDDWLDNLRETSEFQGFLAEHPNLQEER